MIPMTLSNQSLLNFIYIDNCIHTCIHIKRLIVEEQHIGSVTAYDSDLTSPNNEIAHYMIVGMFKKSCRKHISCKYFDLVK